MPSSHSSSSHSSSSFSGSSHSSSSHSSGSGGSSYDNLSCLLQVHMPFQVLQILMLGEMLEWRFVSNRQSW